MQAAVEGRGDSATKLLAVTRQLVSVRMTWPTSATPLAAFPPCGTAREEGRREPHGRHHLLPIGSSARAAHNRP